LEAQRFVIKINGLSNRDMINDFKRVKASLEQQIRDLEKIYIEEVKHNTELAKRNEQLTSLVSFVF